MEHYLTIQDICKLIKEYNNQDIKNLTEKELEEEIENYITYYLFEENS